MRVWQGLFLLENSDNGVAGTVLTREHSDDGVAGTVRTREQR